MSVYWHGFLQLWQCVAWIQTEMWFFCLQKHIETSTIHNLWLFKEVVQVVDVHSGLSLVGAATSIIFVMTSILLLRQTHICCEKTCLLSLQKSACRDKFCHNKHNFVVTKQAYFCHNQHVFVMTKVCLSWQNLSWQNYVCCNKYLSWQKYAKLLSW